MVEVDIVLVTYNGSKWINKCLSSIRESTVQPHVLLIDNCSTDDTLNLVADFNDLSLETIKLDRNLGFGKANNVGLRKSVERGTDYIYLLNQDAYLKPDTLSLLIETHLASNNAYGVLSPLHVNATETALDFNFSRYLMPGKCPDLYSDSLLNQEISNVYTVDFVNAAGWLISQKCLSKVGGFNPIFEHYGEDVNYADRVKYHGYKIGVVPGATMIHDRKSGIEATYDLNQLKYFKRSVLISMSVPGTSFGFVSFLKWLMSKNYLSLINPAKFIPRLLFFIKNRREAIKCVVLTEKQGAFITE
ncbi:MAG: glycosyltransferase family 2 protein [Cyclobacteriaceae bacterium]